MKTAIVILNWNTREYLGRWLPPLLDSIRGLDAFVAVADNASTDGSAAFVEAEFPEVKLIRLTENYGFTGGYDRALAQIEADLFLLLNSDVQVSRGWLEPLVEWMDNHPECGVCGPKILSLDEPGRFEYAGAAGGLLDRFGYPFCRGRVMGRTEPDEGQYDASPAPVLWVSGACLLTRAAVWKELGGLDERFFAHMEEIDYCWRSQLAGYGVTVVPQSAVLHLGGGTLPQDSPFKMKLNYRNNLLLLSKNLPPTIGKRRAAARIFFRRLLDGASALVWLLRGKKENFRAVVQAHREFRALSPVVPTAGCGRVNGLVNKNIILMSVLCGKGIFKHLRKNEYHYRRRG